MKQVGLKPLYHLRQESIGIYFENNNLLNSISDSSAEYGLELFKKLNLQLLIVTPLQKIHIIENYINSVHYVSNTDGNNSELQNMTVEEYKAAKHLHNISINGIEVSETT